MKYYRDLKNVVDTSREEGREQGLEEGREVEARSLILRLLHRRVGELLPAERSQVEALSLPQLEVLGEALLDFTTLHNLQAWLAE